MAVLPATAQADPLTLRFDGTADLTSFGGSASSVFSGSLMWDPDSGWLPEWPGCPDFCLDGSSGAVSATFEIDSVSYTERIDPMSRLSIWGSGALFLDLYFTPAIDLDAGVAPDVGFVELSLWSVPPDYSLFIDNQLPDDLSFLGRLVDRSLVFKQVWEMDGVNADTLTVVPEPASLSLLLIGLSAVGWFARRRRATALSS